MPGSVIVAGTRTPIGKLMGALSTLSAVDLGAHAIGAALSAAHLDPAAVPNVTTISWCAFSTTSRGSPCTSVPLT